jgi:hypothetical protein
MGYEMSISENGKCLVLRVVETVTGPLARRLIKDGLDAVKSRGIRKVLLDVSKVPIVAGAVEQYQLAYDVAVSEKHPRDLKVAILAALDDHSHDFVETVFRNAGYNVALYRDRNAAMEWLAK